MAAWLLCALLVQAAVAKVAVHTPCDEQKSCTVNEVRIDPCASPATCRLTKGSPASISFDFTPDFSASKLLTGLFWARGAEDIPFSVLSDADACPFTPCPTAAGTRQTLDYSLNLSKKLPKGTYEFKWKLWNEEDSTQMCCFKTKIQLR